jgi:DNA-binding transcriptional ArsR family regulator
VRVAPGPDPLWEVLLSAHLLGKRDGAQVFDRWRQRTRPRLSPAMQPLFALAPPWGYSADFLTPPGAPADIDAAIETVLSTPRWRLREDVDQLPAGHPPAALANAIRLGEPPVLRQLGTALSDYHRSSVAPYWNEIEARVRTERARLSRAFLDGGAEQVLSALRPLALWEPPVLSVPAHPADRDIHLDGRGLTLLPSFFCWGAPTTLKNADCSQVLVYPVQHDPTWLVRDTAPSGVPLSALIGRTRATVMAVLAEAPATTTELANRAGISLASASEHANVLRDAGLLTSCRDRNRVHHTLTRLGTELLGGINTRNHL